MGNLTNTQAAYRYYNEKFMQGLRERAQALWLDGYRVTATNKPDTLIVFKETEGPETGYRVNMIRETCSCAFYTKQAGGGELLNDDGEIVPCKHLLGLPGLVKEEMDYWAMRKKYTADERRAAQYDGILGALRTAWANAGK